jgi:hypothetical protein
VRKVGVDFLLLMFLFSSHINLGVINLSLICDQAEKQAEKQTRRQKLQEKKRKIQLKVLRSLKQLLLTMKKVILINFSLISLKKGSINF